MTQLTDKIADTDLQHAIDAIAAVIRADTLAFQKQDFDAWADCWVHDERARDVCVSETAGISILSGWTETASHMKRVFDENLTSKLVDFGQSNLKANIVGNTAWVTFDGWAKHANGGTSTTFETRILERQNHRWKFVYSSFVLRQYGGPDGLILGVDATGRVISSTEAGMKALKRHPYLTISAGRLRAHRRDWDKALQLSIGRAAQHHGFFDTHKFSNDMGGPAQYPTILGKRDEGGVAVVHFSIKDCVTYVRLDDGGLVERRLGHAQKVFDISDAQINVARCVASGKNLRDAADELGVTVNTARTHLSRLYEKTGVRTQAALVRLLLSVG